MTLSDAEQTAVRQLLNREPTPTECAIFSTMWSEHCSYKSSKHVLKTLPTTASNVLLGVGEDAGIVRFTSHDGHVYGIAVSHESHNHPSQVLPVEGAATGVGGVVRDVYCMGADVIGVLDSLHFGDDAVDAPNHMVHHIAQHVVKGVADYGNALGIPNTGGETVYHASYRENCLVNVAAIGLVRADHVIRSHVPIAAKTQPYVMILVGKTTDATGYGGARFSSMILDAEDAQHNLGAVQVHDPFMKRVLVVAIRDMLDYVHRHGIDIGFKDLGAGGVACATSELASASHMGCTLTLDNVSVVDPTLPPEVIACSETQERFCVAVPADHAEAICDIFNITHDMPSMYPGAGATVIGTVTDDPYYRMDYKGQRVCDLPISSITTDVSVTRNDTTRPIPHGKDPLPQDIPIQTIALAMLRRPNNTQKKYVYRHYDQFVKNNSVVIPGEADASVLAPIRGARDGVAMTIDSNTYGTTDPYTAGAYAVAESIRNIIAVGATPLALTDCLNYGNPEDSAVFFDFKQGVAGIGDAARALGHIDDEPIPIISGNVSFYNESANGHAVVPSPVVCCVGHLPVADNAHRMQMTQPDARIYLIGQRIPQFAETELAKTLAEQGMDYAPRVAPQVDFSHESKMNAAMMGLLQQDNAPCIGAVHDVSQGGVWQALVEMVGGDRNSALVGLAIECPTHIPVIPFLFSESGGYLCDVAPQDQPAFERWFSDHGITDVYCIGHTNTKDTITVSHDGTPVIDASLHHVLSDWNHANIRTPGTPIHHLNKETSPHE